jgi:hypothetical protein
VAKLSRDGEELIYSTYLGGSEDDAGESIAVDYRGKAYVTGDTESPDDFPTTEDAFQPEFGGGSNDAFVTKLSSDGEDLIYSTYLGGNAGDEGRGIALEKIPDDLIYGCELAHDYHFRGNAYVTGFTESTDFPTEDAFQDENDGSSDVFVAKLSSDGEELVYSTYLGGSDADEGRAIFVDSNGNAYVTGLTESTDFPTEEAFQDENAGVDGSTDAFVAKLSRDGEELVYSTYLGGRGYDNGFGIAVDGGGNAYVTGDTNSRYFPTKQAFQTKNLGGIDAFVAKLSRDGEELIYSTYLGGSADDGGIGIAVDRKRNVYLTGFTFSTDFRTKDAFQPEKGGDIGEVDAFVSRIVNDYER